MTALQRIDTHLRIETPEATDIFLRPASLFVRAGAYMVDLLIRLLWLTVSMIAISMLGVLFGSDWLIGVFLLNLFVTMWLYPVLFEVLWRGQTPGKRMFKLQVVSDNGAPVGWSISLLRNLLRLADGLPFLYALGMTSVLLHPHNKRIGDVLASTLVVYVDDARSAASWQAVQRVEAVVPPLVLTREEQQALVAFAERQHKLSPARRQELAEQWLLALYGRDDPRRDPLTTVLGMARYLVGEERRGQQQ